MRDAVGGIVNIWIIAVFMVLVSGYLAFAIQYNKAFRMKNEIIEALEQCDGYETAASQSCTDQLIDSYIKQIGYSVGKWNWSECQSSSDCVDKGEKGYYIKQRGCVNSTDHGTSVYYTVATTVNTDIPVFRNLIPNMSLFQVTGNTRRITINIDRRDIFECNSS